MNPKKNWRSQDHNNQSTTIVIALILVKASPKKLVLEITKYKYRRAWIWVKSGKAINLSQTEIKMYESLYLARPRLLLDSQRNREITKVLYWPKEIDRDWLFPYWAVKAREDQEWEIEILRKEEAEGGVIVEKVEVTTIEVIGYDQMNDK